MYVHKYVCAYYILSLFHFFSFKNKLNINSTVSKQKLIRLLSSWKLKATVTNIMDSETSKDIEEAFRQIDIEDEPGSEKNNVYVHNSFEKYYKPKPIERYIPKDYVDFEQYIKENCQNKIRILNRETFRHIRRPIFIFFNHFRFKCAYQTKWLDRLYQLSLKYGDRIEFIAADMIDMDIMYPGRNPMNFFCRIVSPELESPNTYVIDEQKRIYEHFDAYNTVENLTEVCEKLLNGSLLPSQPIPETNEKNLVKICVHHNYDEIILNSSKNIFLIVSLEQCHHFNEPNYEKIAFALRNYNLDIVYMEGEKNYIPFEYNANSYPTILFIPYNDKKNFIYYNGQREEHLIITFLKNVMENPEILQLKQQELKSIILQKVVEVPNDFELEFNNMPQFFKQNFNSRFEVLDRKMLEKAEMFIIIIFMDFSDMMCLASHIQWLNKLYQFVESSYYKCFVADFKDIDIINTKWKPSEIKHSAQGKPKVYVIDYHKHTYEFGNFDSAPALYYFIESLKSRHIYYSQVYSRKNIIEKVKEWTADYFNIFLKKCIKHIFITFYSSKDEKTERISNLLEQLADDVIDLNVEIVKFDVEYNYVDLEYVHDSYPVHYFIPKTNKKHNTLYVDRDLNKNKMLDFIKSNLETKSSMY